MVNDPASTDLIRWSTDGTSFIGKVKFEYFILHHIYYIYWPSRLKTVFLTSSFLYVLVERHEEFAAKVLPRFFKHNTFASFVRQLNMYDFHKVPHIMQGVLVSENEGEVWEFSNSNFQRDQPDLLLLVSRKRSRDRDEKDTNSSELSQLINDIASIKRHQTTISTDLRNLQRDNLILWQDNLAAREKHERHQDMIQKILRFLASVFSSNQIETFSKQKDFILENRPESETSVDAIYNPGMTTPSPQSHTSTGK
jgi:heat shock transcription factor